ncbi:MAG: HlyD family efflux transporter periplasmic adaptor subunit [Reichenbachiella sp.]|uniref:HlyD family secretion protein n=1 Tax=Reichenbachiella sp. TaxID=2184521 RepID=UPI003267B0D6
MNKSIQIVNIIVFLAYTGCEDKSNAFDATGSFEAVETIISAEVSGTLMQFNLKDGQTVEQDAEVGYIDTTQLHLSKKQVQAQMEAILSRKPNISAQLSALNEKLKAAEIEAVRIKNLIRSDAATPKQLDDIQAEIEVIKGNIRAQKSTLNNNTLSIDREIGPLEVQIEQINDQIKKSLLKSPMHGTVLMTYREQHEQVSRGMPIYKLADMEQMTLRAYVTGNQLPIIKLNQKVKVYTDDGEGGYKQTDGILYWISEKAEFTPKTIQTKDERANKVYAIKVRVQNDGTYKIGMYGEVVF